MAIDRFKIPADLTAYVFEQVKRKEQAIMNNPHPTKGCEPVSPSAREMLLEAFDDGERKGVKEYGTVLETFNGRDAAVDAMGELADAAKYVRQLQMELRDRTLIAWAMGNALRYEYPNIEWEVIDLSPEGIETYGWALCCRGKQHAFDCWNLNSDPHDCRLTPGARKALMEAWEGRDK